MTREQIIGGYGKCWDTKELKEDFIVRSFFAYQYVNVTRKSDGIRGVLMFQHRPRLYYDFIADRVQVPE